MNKPEYTIEEILLLLERARMDDVADRLRELWAEKQDAYDEAVRLLAEADKIMWLMRSEIEAKA